MPDETPEAWSPERLAEAGVYVVPEIRNKRVAEWHCVDVWRGGCIMYRGSRYNACAEATRIAKEREKPKVWWIDGDYPGGMFPHPRCVDDPGLLPLILTPDRRVVGERPEEELKAFDELLSYAAKYGMGGAWYCAHRLYTSLRTANAEIAAARNKTP